MSALNGHELSGRALTVNEARSARPERRPRPQARDRFAAFAISLWKCRRLCQSPARENRRLTETPYNPPQMNSEKPSTGGTITMVLPGHVRVALANEHLVLATSPERCEAIHSPDNGDRVRMQMSPYDTRNKARIVYRSDMAPGSFRSPATAETKNRSQHQKLARACPSTSKLTDRTDHRRKAIGRQPK